MRKGIFLFVLTISLLPLSACFHRDEEQQALDLAFDIRKEITAMETFSAQGEIRADYGLRVYDYTLAVTKSDKEISLTVLDPELLSGIVAHCKEGETFLEFEDLHLETGPLDEEGLTPLSSIPALLQAAETGYIKSCGFVADGSLLLHISSPDAQPGTGTEYYLWFDTVSHLPLRGEISVDGHRRIECVFSSFTKE